MSSNVVETYTIKRSSDQDHKHPGVNQYVFGVPLGEGMHGKVVQASDTTNEQAVAIKIMKRNDPHNRKLPKSHRPDVPPPTAQEETEAKIRKEIAVMKKCTHPNVVRLLEVIDDPASKKVYLVMENLEGGEVKWRVRKNREDVGEPVLDLSQIQRIMRDVTFGLEYLHHQGIIHRDIKPANLLWTANCQSVKICDFGVSHFTATTNDPLLCDEAGLSKTAGSPAFFAPELCTMPDFSFEGSSSNHAPTFTPQPITKQIDIWALGVTFYCLLFGKVPWEGHSEFVMFKAICTEDFEVPETMARDCIPTGGRDMGPRREEVGWIVINLLASLLEKDQFKRITLAEIKQIPWVRNGASQGHEKWICDTTQNTNTRVSVTDEEARKAIKPAWYSSSFVARIASTIKRVPTSFSGRPGSSGSTRGSSTPTPSASSSKHAPEQEISSPCNTRSSRPGSRLKCFTFGSVASPSRNGSVTNDSDADLSSTTSSSILWRRNSSAGLQEQPHSAACPPTAGPSTSASTPNRHTHVPWNKRRQSESLHAPRHSMFPCPSTSPVSCPTTPDEHPGSGDSLKRRLTRAVRSNSVRKAVRDMRERKGNHEKEPRGRTSAETLDVLRPSAETDVGLTHAMRASSWGSPTRQVDNEDFDLTVSDVVGSGSMRVIQDFNKSVVKFGAGGYVDSPGPVPRESGTRNGNVNGNGVVTVGSQMAEMTLSNSSDSTTQQPYMEPPYLPPRVRSPLTRACADGGMSSDVFDDIGTEDDSSDEDVLELRTRRPSAVLSRSARASPIR